MARNLSDPPDVPPEILWRSLLTLSPERVLSTRLRGAEHVPLIVRAVPAMAEQRARDAAAQAGVPEHARDLAAARAVLALVLRTPSGPAFASAAALGALDSHELSALMREALAALADIAPTYARSSNGKAWREALTAGARDVSNLDEASVLASCIDATPNGGCLPRPDRYWGVPLSALLDGHWMAFQTARAAVKDRR